MRLYWNTATLIHVGFPGGSDGKESAHNMGDLGSIPGREDPLGKGMATHSSILGWEIPWTEEPGGLQSIVFQNHCWRVTAAMKLKDACSLEEKL